MGRILRVKKVGWYANKRTEKKKRKKRELTVKKDRKKNLWTVCCDLLRTTIADHFTHVLFFVSA